MANDPLERLHLSFLKCTSGVNKYTSNATVWGDTDRYPPVITHAKQVFAYLERLEKLDKENSQALVRHAFKEQENSALDWLSGLRRLKTGLERVHSRCYPFPSQIHYGLKAWFENVWNAERQINRKLSFNNSIKETFKPELYLSIDLGYWESKHIAQFRTSSHSYNIETGRHGQKINSIVNRLCPNCSPNADDTMTLLAELLFFEPILENELHILIYCPSYSVLRDNLKNASKTALQDDLKSFFHSEPTIRDISNFLKKAHDRRFPERYKNIKHKSTQTENQ